MRARPLAWALVVVAVVSTVPAGATTTAERIARADRRVALLAADIAVGATALEDARGLVAAAEARLDTASRRLALLQDARRRLDVSIADASAELDGIQDRLDALSAEAYMSQGGDLDAGAIAAFLDARTLAELGDRLVFGDAATVDLQAVAVEAAEAEARIRARRAAVEALVAAAGVLVSQAEAAEVAAAAALEAEAAALAVLDGARDRAVAFARRLRRQLDGVPALDLSRLGEALHGVDSVTYGRWAELFLGVLGAPTCRQNLVVVVAWQVAESTQAAWNPLATTRRMPGSTDFNSVGVQDFTSLVQGLRATKDTIDFGRDVYRYGDIVASLRACERSMDTARAINASSWCPGCVDGQYVLNVVPRVEADLATYLAL